MPTQRAPVVVTDPRAMRALAHPARLAVLEELFAGQELTATQCAELVGLSASAMSYHLRALQKWGLVEPAESSDGRERPWRATGSDLRVESGGPQWSKAAESAVAADVLARVAADVAAHLSDGGDVDRAWIASSALWLTEDEALALNAAVEDLTRPFRDRRARAGLPEGASAHRVAYVLVPLAGKTRR